LPLICLIGAFALWAGSAVAQEARRSSWSLGVPPKRVEAVTRMAEVPQTFATETDEEGTTLGGSRFAVRHRDDRIVVRLAGFADETENDLIVLATPPPRKGADPATLSVERLVVRERATDRRLTWRPNSEIKGGPTFEFYLNATLRAFSLKTTGWIGDVHVQALTWSLLTRTQEFQLIEAELHLILPEVDEYREDPSSLRRMSNQQLDRVERLLGNPLRLGYARRSEPPLYADHQPPDWEFHRMALDHNDRPTTSTWRTFTNEKQQVYAIGPEWLKSAGFPDGTTDPKRARIFTAGGEVPTWLMGDGRVAFLALPSDSPYTKVATYWVDTSGDATPKRLAVPSLPDTDGRPWSKYRTARQEFLVDRDLRFLTSRDQFLTILDFRWVERELPLSVQTRTEFDLPQYSPTDDNLNIKLGLFAVTERGDYMGNMSVRLNGSLLGDYSYSGRNSVALELKIPGQLLRSTRNELLLEERMGVPADGRLYLDTISIVHDRELYADTSPYAFSILPDGGETPREFSISDLAASGSTLFALNIEDPRQPKLVSLEIDQNSGDAMLRPEPGAGGKFLVFGDFDILQPPEGKPVQHRPELRFPGASIDHWIVYHPDFTEGALRLAEYRTKQGHVIALATTDQIYAEFSQGEQSPDAIRRFLAWQARNAAFLPGSVLLIGDCTHDYRGDFRNNVGNFLPSYRQGEKETSLEKFPVDMLFGCVIGDDLMPEFAVSRLSVTTMEDLNHAIDKIIEYDEKPIVGPWRVHAALVADSGGFSTETKDARLRRVPPAWTTRSVHLEDYPWMDNFFFTREEQLRARSKISPDATTAVRGLFNDWGGLWSLSYWGHGSPNIWSTERMWFGGNSRNSDNLLLDNAPRLPFISNMTCNTGAIDYPEAPWNICMTEDLMRQRRGGALAVFAPGGMGFTATHRRMATALDTALYDPTVKTVGDVATLARWWYALEGNPDDILRMYILQGDPLSVLQRPAAVMDITVGTRFFSPETTTVSVQGEIPRNLLPREAADDDEKPLAPSKFHVRVTDPNGAEVLRRDGVVGSDLITDQFGRFALALQLPPMSLGQYALSFYVWREPAAGERPQNNDASGGTKWIVAQPIIAVESLATVSPKAETPDSLINFIIQARNEAPVDAHSIPFVIEEGDATLPKDKTTWTPRVTILSDLFGNELRQIEASIAPTHPISVWRSRAMRHAAPAPPKSQVLRLEGVTHTWRADLPVGLYLLPWASGIETPPRARDLTLKGRVTMMVQPDASNEVQEKILLFLPTGEVIASSEALHKPQPSIQPISFVVKVDPVSGLPIGERVKGSTEGRVTARLGPISATIGNIVGAAPEPNPRPGKGDMTIVWKPETLPDLAIEKVVFTPERPTEGETVFFTVTVANLGQSPAQALRVQAFDASLDPQSLASAVPLPDRTEMPKKFQEQLEPGTRRNIVVRWDPETIPPDGKVRLAADTNTNMIEPSLANNESIVQIPFRKKFELTFVSKPQVQIQVVDPAVPTVRLTSTVSNLGETEAERVEVQFYASQAAMEDGKPPVGVAMIEVVEPLVEKTVSVEWVVPRELARVGISPVVVAAIKGSRQRVTTAPTEGDGMILSRE